MPQTTPIALGHPRAVLASCLMRANEVYSRLLESASSQQYKEAGKTVRRLARCLAEIDQFDVNDFDEPDEGDEELEELEEEGDESV